MVKDKMNINLELEKYLEQRAEQWKKDNKRLRTKRHNTFKLKKAKIRPLSKKVKSKLDKSEGDVIIIEESPKNWFQRVIDSFFNLFSNEIDENLETEEMKEEINEESKELGLTQEDKESISDKLNEDETESNQSFLYWMKNIFEHLFYRKKYQEIKELKEKSKINSDELEGDLKSLFKIMNKIITTLPPRCIVALKSSDSFQEYKKYIQKYNLIWAARKRINLLEKKQSDVKNKELES